MYLCVSYDMKLLKDDQKYVIIDFGSSYKLLTLYEFVKKLVILSLIALVCTITIPTAFAQEQIINSYPSKFLCGTLPNFTFEDPLTPGDYATVVDIHNPSITNSTFEWKAVLDDGKISPFQNRTLAPNAATKIDCKDIRDTLNNTSTDFLVGFVILRHDAPADKKLEEIFTLDVVTAYTYYEKNSGVSTDLETIKPQKVARSGDDDGEDDCDPWDAMVKNDRKLMLACGNDPAFFSVLEINNFVTHPDVAIHGIDYTVTILESEKDSEINEPWGGNESPDGRYLLGVDMYNIAPVGVEQEKGSLYIWDSNSLELLGKISHEDSPEYVGVAPRSVIMTDEWVFVFNSGTHRISDKPSQLEGIPFFYGDAQGSITKIPTEVIYEMFPLSEVINDIRVLILDNKSEIQILSDGEPIVYTLDTVKEDEILDSISSHTNLNSDEVRNIWKVTEVKDNGKGGGCLIATATFGSELAPQVQQLRELRDNHLLQTESGTSFMSSFNNFYYSFSPIIADYERENPVFKELVKIGITPMVSSLSILNYVDMNSEAEVLGYGISLIILNLGMYVGIPASMIIGIRKFI